MDTEEEEILGLKLKDDPAGSIGLCGRCQLDLVRQLSRTVAVTETAFDSEANHEWTTGCKSCWSNATSRAMLKTGRSCYKLGGNYLERINKDQSPALFP